MSCWVCKHPHDSEGWGDAGSTGLPTFEEACEDLTDPAHMARFGEQVHVKGVLGGTEEAGRHVGYLTKYLTKSVGQAAGLTETATDRQREHARRLHAELQITPCSPRCAVWLLYGVQPQGARHSMTPGRCKARHTSPNTSASPAAASWSPARGPARPSTTTAPSAPPSFGNSSTTPASDPPTASRTAPTCGNDQHPARPTSHPRPALLLHAVAERQRWKAEYTAAQHSAAEAPPGLCAAAPAAPHRPDDRPG